VKDNVVSLITKIGSNKNKNHAKRLLCFNSIYNIDIMAMIVLVAYTKPATKAYKKYKNSQQYVVFPQD